MMNSSTDHHNNEVNNNNNNNVNHHHQKEVVGEDEEEEDIDDVPLPGFRFHPTDEELLGFYLTRKVDKRPTSIELIKHVDIYKYDPWDLPNCKAGSNVGEKEWYFYCKRGRKYKNSIRPNRVTTSGFWKATGIDRPVYSRTTGGGRGHCIGLKKSLVFYRGAAGKGTKTDWMMHEFRLPPPPSSSSSPAAPHHQQQEAEVWTLCRILKRNLTYNNNNNNKCMPPHMAAKQPNSKQQQPCSRSSSNSSLDIINFRDPLAAGQKKKKQQDLLITNWNETMTTTPTTVLDIESSTSSNLINNNNNDNYYYYNYNTKYGNWETLSSVVDSCFSTPSAAPAHQYHPFYNNY